MEEVGDEWRGYFLHLGREEGVGGSGSDSAGMKMDGWMMEGEKRRSWVSLAFTSSPARLPPPTRPFWWSPSINSKSILSFLPPLTPSSIIYFPFSA